MTIVDTYITATTRQWDTITVQRLWVAPDDRDGYFVDTKELGVITVSRKILFGQGDPTVLWTQFDVGEVWCVETGAVLEGIIPRHRTVLQGIAGSCAEASPVVP